MDQCCVLFVEEHWSNVCFKQVRARRVNDFATFAARNLINNVSWPGKT